MFRVGKEIEIVHRFSYKLYYGKFDLSYDVLHRCDNKLCVNPDHLVEGTHQDNMDDMVRKGILSRRGAGRGAHYELSRARPGAAH